MNFKKILTVLLFSCVFSLLFINQTFAVNNKIDYFGYYMPKKEWRIGNFRLNNIAIASAMDVKSYKSCQLRSPSANATYAPVMFEFKDHTNNSTRVLPQTCQVSGNSLSFNGTDKQIGKISFVGTFDLAALKNTQNKNDSNGDKTVLLGDLIINGKTFKNIEFEWFGGD